MKTVMRNYKDSLFRDIFKDEKRLAEIYAGMFDEPVAAIDIELAALDWTFFTGIRNDVSFLVRQQYIVLLEHQSTLNANMPLRMLDYIAQLYRQYIDADAIYRERLIALPAPRLHVLYNGEAEMPSRWEMRLSDAFASQKGDMEVVVHVWNINDSSKHGILRKCRALKAYSVFVAQVRNMIRHGCDMESSVRQAIQYCIDHDWLREYFKQKQESEVFDMVNFVWNQDRALQIRAEEAMQEGIEKGREEMQIFSIRKLMKNQAWTAEKAMEVLEIPKSERVRYRALL